MVDVDTSERASSLPPFQTEAINYRQLPQVINIADLDEEPVADYAAEAPSSKPKLFLKTHWAEILWLSALALFLLNLAYLLWPQQVMTLTVEPHPETLKNLPVLVQTQTPEASVPSYALVTPDTTSSTPIKAAHVSSQSGHSHETAPKKEFHGIIHINTATLEEWEKLPGIGPKMAERIIAYRKAQGPFHTCDDLQNVSGIGPKKLEKILPACKL